MEFVVSGISFTISEELQNYNFYRKEFSELSDIAAKKFEKGYDEHNHSLDDVINNAPNQFFECLAPAIEVCIKRLAEKNILSYNQTKFLEEYYPYIDNWSEIFNDIEAQYAAIVLDEKQMDAYRTMRRKTRGRVIGGGFGVSGALQGMATAGAMNAAAGTAHMLFNGIGKIGSSMKSSSQKAKIFNDPDTKSKLVLAVSMSVFNCHYALIHCIMDHDPSFPCAIILPEATEKAMIQYGNLKYLAQDPPRMIDGLMEVWKLNPYNSFFYDTLLRLVGDKDEQLEKMAEYFGYDICPVKLQILQNRRDQLSVSTEDLAKTAYEQLCKEADRLSLPHDCDIIHDVDLKLKEFDQKARTVDDMVLKTREEAATAKTELQAIRKVVSETDCDDPAELERLLPQLAKFKSPVARKHIKALQNQLDLLKEEEKCVHSSINGIPPLKFDSAEQAQAAAKELEQAETILNAHDLGQLDEITKAKQAVADLKLSPPVNTAVQKMLQKRKFTVETQIKCTFFDKQYDSSEEKEQVEKEYHKIKTKLMMHPDQNEIMYIHQQLDTLDFPDAVQTEIKRSLAAYEDAVQPAAPAISKSSKTSASTVSSSGSSSATSAQKAVDTIVSLVLLAIIVAAIFVRVTVTPSFDAHSIRVLDHELLIIRHQTSSVLTVIDGLKNGVLVFGETIVLFFMEGFTDFIAGFQFHLVGNVLWLCFGWIWILLKEAFFSIPRYFITLVMIGKEPASIGYHIAYVASALFPWLLGWISNRFGSPKD